MTGAFVTSSGDAYRGFHQSPNVLRDVYMPKIGVDGYGFLQYLISWANANTSLSQRRMKKDLKVSQDKLERIQNTVRKYCGHFLHFIQGDASTTNRWHLDMEMVWRENAAHLAAGYAVPEIGTPPAIPVQAVPKTVTGRTGNRYGTVPKTGTFKDNTNTTKKQKKNILDADASDSPSGKVRSKVKATHEGGGSNSESSGSAGSAPDGAASDEAKGLNLPSSGTQQQPLAPVDTQATDKEAVPGAAAEHPYKAMYHELWQAVADIRAKGKESAVGAKAKDALAAGFTPEDARAAVSWAKADAWWSTKLTPGRLVEILTAWDAERQAKRPSYARPAAPVAESVPTPASEGGAATRIF